MKTSAGYLVLASLPVAVLAQSLVPTSFDVAKHLRGTEDQLGPSGPAVADLDFKFYTGSIEHVSKSMDGGSSPSANLTMTDQAKDMSGERGQCDGRKSFPYAVLSSGGRTESGCFYIEWKALRVKS